MTKIYAIYGRSTVNITIPTRNGKSFIQAEFTKGCPNGGGNYRPATFTTSDAVVQQIIEDSPYFGGLIKIWRAFGEDGQEQAPAAPVVEKPKVEKKTEFPEVTDREGMLVVLKANGAKAAVLVDEDATRKFIDKKGLKFPNFEF